MLLGALQTRTAAASTLAGRSLLAGRALRSPIAAAERSSKRAASSAAASHQTANPSENPASAAAMPGIRTVKQVVQGQKQMEGAGVRICRTIGTSALRNLDPFLMLDELKMPPNEATAGFPDHPHRGFETCSIMLSGKMEHHDHVGNHGIIGPGGVQWMTAGRGIVHSEMPVATDDKYLWGFQLWINLPAKLKMTKPRYQDYQAADIPTATTDGVKVRVMAGTSLGTTGPIKMINPGTLLDVQLEADASFTQEVPESYNGFCYVYEGAGKIGGTKAKVEQNLVMGPGDKVQADAGSEGLKFLLVAGKPIGEPIVQYGPFVMNTEKEIQQAFMDFQSGKLQNPEDDVWAES